jgi:hypothetical protein
MAFRWVAWLLAMAMALAFMGASTGCHGQQDSDRYCNGSGDCTPPVHSVHELLCAPEQCVDKPADGFTGPSWYWIGTPENLPAHCPGPSDHPGAVAYADASPEVQPPCAATQDVHWGTVARECLIAAPPTCADPAQLCAPLPPDGYSLCIYQDDEADCPPDPSPYTDRYRLLRHNPDNACSGMGVEPITLCCASSRRPVPAPSP